MEIISRFEDFLHLFIPISKDKRLSFYDAIVKENFLRLAFISAIYLGFEITRYLRAPRLDNDFLLILSNMMIFFQALMLGFAVWQVIGKRKLSGRLAQVVIVSYCLVVMYWAVSVGLNNIRLTGSMSMYVMALVVTSALFFRRAIFMVLTNIGFYLYFHYQLFHTVMFRLPPKNPGREQDILTMYKTDALLITVISCLLGFIIIRLRLRVFREHQALKKMATQDAMTEVMNHEAICNVLEIEVERARRYNHPLAVLLVDIDHFKQINDSYGHRFGDEVIKKVASLMKENCRRTDYVGRYGGDEFLIIMTNTDTARAYELSDRLRETVASYDFSKQGKITLSCGLMETSDGQVEDPVHYADLALYQSKASGRNKVTIFKEA